MGGRDRAASGKLSSSQHGTTNIVYSDDGAGTDRVDFSYASAPEQEGPSLWLLTRFRDPGFQRHEPFHYGFDRNQPYGPYPCHNGPLLLIMTS